MGYHKTQQYTRNKNDKAPLLPHLYQTTEHIELKPFTINSYPKYNEAKNAQHLSRRKMQVLQQQWIDNKHM
jgi:hypothetical protein